jgi:GPH family glycoside/pentoside/hexuronide:cation symporter
VGIVLGMIISDNIVRTMGTHINVYYVFEGNQKAGALMQGSSQTFYAVMGLIGVLIVAPLATRFGKLRVIRVCLACGILAAISQFFFYSREYPWLQFISMLLLAPSFSGFWVLIDPMKADTADYDEYKTGLRREGMYAAVATWLEKTTLTGAILIFGLVLDLSGFKAGLGGAQSETSLLTMRLLFSAAPALILIGSFLLACRYPLDDARQREVQAELRQRRQATNS